MSGEQGPGPAYRSCRGSLDGPWLPSQPCPHQASATPPTGKVYQWEDPDPKLFDNRYGAEPATPVDPTTAIHLRCVVTLYKELQLQGFNYGPNFQGILEASSEGRCKEAPLCALGPTPAAWCKGATRGPQAGAHLRRGPHSRKHLVAWLNRQPFSPATWASCFGRTTG